MAQSLDDQIITIERALGERMIEHALIIVRSWLNELGENNPYEQAFNRIRASYGELFERWLTSEDPTLDEQLDQLTSNTYRLVDAAYVDLRLLRGLSPTIHGFNKEAPQSIMHYFSNCVRFSEEDWRWVSEIMQDSERSSEALMVMAALAKNIRECFSEQGIMVLIDGISSNNEIISQQCLANLILLFAHYDVRVDFFPDLQKAFADAILAMDDQGETAFQCLCAVVRSVKKNWMEQYKNGELTMEDFPQELQDLLALTGKQNDITSVMSWLPASEQEYMQGLIEMLPDTWVYALIIGDDEEHLNPQRAEAMALVYLSIGHMGLLWEHVEVASKWLLHHLREGKATPQDYINYAHCLMLQGDRMMAFEYYKQARQMCTSVKEFYSLFRPDRRALVDHGVPVEQIYLLEDNLINN